MSSQARLIDPSKLIEYGDHVITFKATPVGSKGEDSIMVIGEPGKFVHPNEAGHLRSVESLEEACLEGQKAALDLKAMIDLDALAS